MSRPPLQPRTALGFAIRERRAGMPSERLAQELGLAQSSVSRLERGAARPSTDTARALARWLGWSMEQVIEAADQPAPSSDAPGQTP